MKFTEWLKKLFLNHIPLKLLALGLGFLFAIVFLPAL